MILPLLSAVTALLIGLAMPGLASAQPVAYTAPGPTNMRTGPGTDHAVVARVAGGSTVTVHGCLSDYSWCDTSSQGTRGWIFAGRLEFEHGGRLVPIQSNGSSFEAPRVVFDDAGSQETTPGADFGYLGGSPTFEEDDLRAGRRDRPAPDLPAAAPNAPCPIDPDGAPC